MYYIDTQVKLVTACQSINNAEIMAIDTEFDRRHTYFAKLSVVQIATCRDIFIIDILACDDLAPLKTILTNHSIIKILHAGRQDLEIFWHYFNIIPQNIFDTQIAAACCNFQSSISYADLCFNLLNVQLDKSYQKANWLSRPIIAEQLDYAAADVIYLIQIYYNLLAKLTYLGAESNYNTQVAKLLDINLYKINYANSWQKIEFSNIKTPNFGFLLQHISAFREEQAVKFNVPRKYIATDKELILLCQKLPTTLKSINNMQLQSRYLQHENVKNHLLDLCRSLSELSGQLL